VRRRQPQTGSHAHASRLIAALVVLCLAPLGLLTWFSLSLSAKAVRGQVDARVQNTASASAVYVKEQMDGLTELVGSYAKRPAMIRAMRQPGTSHNGATIGYHLRELQQARRGIDVTFATDPSGRLLDIVPPTPSIVGKDFSFRDWYKGVTASGRPYVSEAYQTAASGHAQVVGAAVQVREPAGDRERVLGIVVAAYGLDTIQHFVDDYATAQGIRLTVTDQRGVVLATPGTTRAGPVISAGTPVPGLGWRVTADVATATAFAPIAELRRTVLTISALLGLVLLAGLALLARSLRERSRAEQRVLAGEARTRDILEATAEAFISIDAAGVVTSWNSQAATTFGWAREQAVGRPLTELIIPEESRQAHDLGRRRFLESGDGPLLNRRAEVTALHKAGHRFPVELVIWPSGSGPETVFNAFAHDISERKQAEQVLREAKREADRANVAKSEFLSRMSHELRTPLNAILGFGQLLQLEDLTADQSESVEHMLRGGRHLLELINEVLDISRIESGNLSLSPEPVELGEVVRDTVDLIRPLAAERQITIEAPAADDPTWTVQADRQRLKQVLLNLASNAVKYNRHAGTIRFTCRAAPDSRVAIAVQDTGLGLSPDKMARLFSPFDRLGAEETEVQGTGMGLALSKGLMEAMGGDLTAHSVEGEGTTFTVELAGLAEAAGVPSPS
jgi:PAS domain S-box-containing protein